LVQALRKKRPYLAANLDQVILHQDNKFISSEVVYAKKNTKQKTNKKTPKKQRIEKIAILFSRILQSDWLVTRA
jgi:hypothetical protein